MKTMLYSILIVFCVSCTTTRNIEYKLLNDIIDAESIDSKKVLVSCYCEQRILFKDVKSAFNSNRKKLISKELKFQTSKNKNWVFDDNDVIYLLNHYKDSVYTNCWDKSKIKKKNIAFLTCKEVDSMSENWYIVTKGKSIKSLFEKNQYLYISKPFFNATKNKAILFYGDSEKDKETTPKIAIVEKINRKWGIIGYIYKGID